MRHFFIEPSAVNAQVVVIGGSEARHIKNVLRLQPGDIIRLFDGTGWEYEAVINDLFAGRVETAILRKFPAPAESAAEIIVAQAFLKEKKMDTLVRQLSELGVRQWLPFACARSVPRPAATRLAGRLARWRKIAQEALKQCRRADLLTVNAPMSFADVVNFGQTCEIKFIFWENASSGLDSAAVEARERRQRRILLMLGPEGGFTSGEIEHARNQGFVVAGLGPRILRAETATVAACALIQFLFGDMGQKFLDKNQRI
ncbi:MAG: 16S rRNA (uracil(1498)-N(3))-methyltransferase [Desulfobacterales bacterium]|nr:MAG: 16S rRNA (uracil(1498)-N(3))-methyltransferase [Desulfobacterales bacterium]